MESQDPQKPIAEAKKSIKPLPEFSTVFETLLEEWEDDRKNDDSLPSAVSITSTLWGNKDSWTPYCYLDDEDSPSSIISAIRGYISEFHNSDAWGVMDRWIQPMSGSGDTRDYPSIDVIIETFESVIYYEARPDLDDY
ncbi:MAG: hypothetical protein PF442_04115 [Desulfobulbaceae bacterium]|jgi:hypothetical protein|nr:hypothetical protein [Desulfobulbaceae bacterium]